MTSNNYSLHQYFESAREIYFMNSFLNSFYVTTYLNSMLDFLFVFRCASVSDKSSRNNVQESCRGFYILEFSRSFTAMASLF